MTDSKTIVRNIKAFPQNIAGGIYSGSLAFFKNFAKKIKLQHTLPSRKHYTADGIVVRISPKEYRRAEKE